MSIIHKEMVLFLAAGGPKGGGQRAFWRDMMKLSDETGYIKGGKPDGAFADLQVLTGF